MIKAEQADKKFDKKHKKSQKTFIFQGFQRFFFTEPLDKGMDMSYNIGNYKDKRSVKLT